MTELETANVEIARLTGLLKAEQERRQEVVAIISLIFKSPGYTPPGLVVTSSASPVSGVEAKGTV